jgi:hypothetical protein
MSAINGADSCVSIHFGRIAQWKFRKILILFEILFDFI